MPARRIEEAFERLAAGDRAVFGPTTDGGYDLLGLAGPGHPFFVGVEWSTSEVMAASREAAKQAGLRYSELGLGYDLDEFEDLSRALADTEDGRAPRTRAALLALLQS